MLACGVHREEGRTDRLTKGEYEMDPEQVLKDMRATVRAYNAGPQLLTAEEADGMLQDMMECFDALDGWMRQGGYSPWGRS